MADPDTPTPDDFDDPQRLLDAIADDIEDEENRRIRTPAADAEARIRALETSRRRLELLLQSTQLINRIDHVDQLLDRMLELALELSGADRAFFLTQNHDGTLEAAASRNRAGESLVADHLDDISQTVLERVLQGGKTLHVSDALNNPDFTASRSIRELSLQTILCVPLQGPEGVAGALYVDSNSATGLIDEDGVKILEAFAAQAGITLETVQHRQRLEETAETLETVNRSLKQALGERTRFDRIIGESPAMQAVFDTMERVVDTPVTVLLQGETGTGKELVAQALHFNGPRREKHFTAINCGAIPEQLLESELFGHRKGAFTGAERDHVGLVETADGGTLFLDEIADMPMPLQVKLLRMLQEGEVRRIGDSESRPVDVRVITATHKNLKEEVEENRFREDLFYRINVVTLKLPPLRDRGEDVIRLAEFYLERARERLQRPDLKLGAEARRALLAHTWPGNVRELGNAVERAVALSQGEHLEPADLLPDAADAAPRLPKGGSLKEMLLRAEADAIRAALDQSDGNISQAARQLGVSRQHLHTRIKKLEIRN